MDNISDVYYLLQLIIRQIFVYLWDFTTREFSWILWTNEDLDAKDTKIFGFKLKNVTGDFVAFFVICIFLFLLIILTSKCDKDERNDYDPSDMDTISVDFPDDSCGFSKTNSSGNFIHACGDSIHVKERLSKRNSSSLIFPRTEFTVNESPSRSRSSENSRSSRRRSQDNRNISKKSAQDLKNDQPLYTQSTQTNEKMFHRGSREWLIRRTRSGQIYGKYPV